MQTRVLRSNREIGSGPEIIYNGASSVLSVVDLRRSPGCITRESTISFAAPYQMHCRSE